MMANQIGVARTVLANLPITRHSQDRVLFHKHFNNAETTILVFYWRSIAVELSW